MRGRGGEGEERKRGHFARRGAARGQIERRFAGRRPAGQGRAKKTRSTRARCRLARSSADDRISQTGHTGPSDQRSGDARAGRHDGRTAIRPARFAGWEDHHCLRRHQTHDRSAHSGRIHRGGYGADQKTARAIDTDRRRCSLRGALRTQVSRPARPTGHSSPRRSVRTGHRAGHGGRQNSADHFLPHARRRRRDHRRPKRASCRGFFRAPRLHALAGAQPEHGYPRAHPHGPEHGSRRSLSIPSLRSRQNPRRFRARPDVAPGNLGARGERIAGRRADP